MKCTISAIACGASAGFSVDAPPALDTAGRTAPSMDGRIPSGDVGRNRPSMRMTLLLSMALVAGCDWFSDPTPEEARVLISGSAGSTVELIVSSKFVAGVNDAGLTRVEIFESDTITTTLPFDRTFSIRGDYKFFAQAARTTADISSFRMEVFIDADREFDETGPLLAEAPFRFVFQFNQFLTDNIDVVF
jgi:hypothetical protein